MSRPHDDAKGQYAPSQADRKADGVHSAKPTVVKWIGRRDRPQHAAGSEKAQEF